MVVGAASAPQRGNDETASQVTLVPAQKLSFRGEGIGSSGRWPPHTSSSADVPRVARPNLRAYPIAERRERWRACRAGEH